LGIANIFVDQQTHYVVENTRKVSGIGQNNPNLEHFEGSTSNLGTHKYFFQKQTQQVVENICKVSGIGQNNPNLGHLHGLIS